MWQLKRTDQRMEGLANRHKPLDLRRDEYDALIKQHVSENRHYILQTDVLEERPKVADIRIVHILNAWELDLQLPRTLQLR